MRSLESDVPKTISQVLSTHKFQKRKELIEKVFVPESKFWHLFFQTVNRRELFGVYQMWGAYNFWIGVKYTRVVPDKKHNRVVVDLIETINVWWTPFPYLGIPIHLNLHVVLGLQQHPDAEHSDDLIFTFQEDHIFWVESFLLYNPILTLGLGPLALKYLRPPAGSAYAAIGKWKYARLEISNQYQRRAAGFVRIEHDLKHAIATAYGGSPEDKWECSQRMYAEDAEFWHPLFIVKGRENIFGAHMFWASINRRTDAHIQRIVLSQNDDIALIDLEQQFWPYFFPKGWKCFALWVHVILTLEDGKDGKGKVITKQEDHILWVESLVMRNLGPVSRVFNKYFRRQNGRFFCFLGNFIYAALVWITSLVHRCQHEYNAGQKQGLFTARTAVQS